MFKAFQRNRHFSHDILRSSIHIDDYIIIKDVLHGYTKFKLRVLCGYKELLTPISRIYLNNAEGDRGVCGWKGWELNGQPEWLANIDIDSQQLVRPWTLNGFGVKCRLS